MNGVKGLMFKSDKNGNSIFLPAAGFRDRDGLDGVISYRSLQNTFGITPYLRGYLFNVQDSLRVFLSVQASCRFASGYQSYGAYVRLLGRKSSDVLKA